MRRDEYMNWKVNDYAPLNRHKFIFNIIYMTLSEIIETASF